MIVALLLPMGVLMTFILMYNFGIDANIVALSGIAIAIGVMADVGIVDIENINRHMEMPGNHNLHGKPLRELIYNATTQVRMAVIIGIGTTIISFLPVFAMEAAEGKMFKPLAFTKTFAILSSLILGFVILPTLAYFVFSIRTNTKKLKHITNIILIGAGTLIPVIWGIWPLALLIIIGLNNIFENKWTAKYQRIPDLINQGIVILFALYYLISEWLPLGAQNHFVKNFIFVILIIGSVLTILSVMVHYYEPVLRWCLANKIKFLAIPVFTTLFGILVWIGFDSVFGFVAKGPEKIGWNIRNSSAWQGASKVFPGIGKEFMPSLNEGSFLLMPTSMPHAGIEKNIEYVRMLDIRLASIPEVEVAVGKWGRVNSALDPANTQMFENIINYKPEYILDNSGQRMRFKIKGSGNYLLKDGTTYNPDKDGFKKMDTTLLIADNRGEYFRQWRPDIRKPDDIWKEIVKVTQLPGLTSAPKLQPIETRLVMLSTGMRAPMGIKVYGPDIETIEKTGIDIENQLKNVPSVEASSVFADRGVGAPYLLINIKRESIARYGLSIKDVQDAIQSAVGGMELTRTVEGRERFPVRVRYARELRTTPDDLKNILISSMTGTQVPLGELADIEYSKGPQMIRSENTFLTSFVIFDKKTGLAEVDVVNQAQDYLKSKIASGELVIPKGVTYHFSGNYEQQVRATKRLGIVIPISLLLIFLLLYFQFKTVTASFIHFSGVLVAFGGGFILLWLYGQGWFMDFTVSGVNMRDLFQIHTINLSVAVWVGFISLFGLATNDGVIMGTYIHQVFEERKPHTVKEVREAVLEAGKKRVRPAMMTAAVIIIALLPVLTSTGKGADVMVPIAIPTFGGMVIQLMTMYVVPVLQSMWRERAVKKIIKV
jgi:Cu(I)/Ag(I) efflux system membrane protein CusA/SilA